MARKTLSLRESRARKAQRRRSKVKTLPSPVGGWNARDALSAMPEKDAVALVNFFPETTDVILRHGSELWGNLSGGIGAGNALLIDGISGYATTPDAAAIDVTGDIDLRAYANLDDWTTSTAQFFIAKGVPGTDASYQFFVIDGRMGCILYTAAGAIAGAFISDIESLVPAVNGSPLWVRVTVDIDNGAGFSVGTFYTSDDSLVWSQLGGVCIQLSFAAIANSAQPLELGRGAYPTSVTYNNPPLLTCDSADFDGINDYMLRGSDLTGDADGKKGIFSCWIRLDASTSQVLLTNSDFTSTRFAVRHTAAGIFIITALNAALSTILSIQANGPYNSGATWLHLLASWDLATAGARHIYVTDVADLTVTTFTNDTIDYTTAQWAIAAFTGGANMMDGCLAELYFTNTYLDFSVVTNRRKFISASGKPVHLGATGSLPTGTAPLIYQHLADAEAPANFATNRGTGGNFSITGTLDTGSTSPSD